MIWDNLKTKYNRVALLAASLLFLVLIGSCRSKKATVKRVKTESRELNRSVLTSDLDVVEGSILKTKENRLDVTVTPLNGEIVTIKTPDGRVTQVKGAKKIELSSSTNETESQSSTTKSQTTTSENLNDVERSKRDVEKKKETRSFPFGAIIGLVVFGLGAIYFLVNRISRGANPVEILKSIFNFKNK